MQEVIQLRSDGIDHGMSGAAVLDFQNGGVIEIVSEYLSVELAKQKFLEVAKTLPGISFDKWTFNRILARFVAEGKIVRGEEFVEYAHSSYALAVRYLISAGGIPTLMFTKILSPVLLNLVSDPETSEQIPWFVYSNFKMLPKDSRDELILICSNHQSVIPN
jgi:hypothetical protein